MYSLGVWEDIKDGTKICEWAGVHKKGEGKYLFRAFCKDADRAELTGDFNSWGNTQMTTVGKGFFETFIDSEVPLEGTCYKYRFYIDDKCLTLPDAFAAYSQWGKDGASIVYFGEYEWGDEEWMAARGKQNGAAKSSAPINIYELHLGTWRTREGRSYADGDLYLNYRDIALQLADYVSDMGYTHVCLLPIAEKESPCPFSPTSKHGRPDDFKFFVDTLHRSGIGVMLEWSPPEVFAGLSELSVSSVLYWLRDFHIDGIYARDISRDGLSMLCKAIKDGYSDVLTVSDSELTDLAIDRVFDETVTDYAESDAEYKKYKYAGLNRSLTSGFDKYRILPVSCASVPEQEGSLFEKMQGSYDEKFARMRLFYCFMMSHPGKKMTFMGCETGEKKRWNGREQLDWFLLECDANKGLKRLVKRLNKLYLEAPALWENDFSWRGFEWIEYLSEERGVLSFSRLSSKGDRLIAAFNFCENETKMLQLPEEAEISLNSDGAEFGGKGRGGRDSGILYLPPLSAALLKCEKKQAFFEKALDYSPDV